MQEFLYLVSLYFQSDSDKNRGLRAVWRCADASRCQLVQEVCCMCDFSPVRNWLIAFFSLVAAAVSSAVFAWAWSTSGTPWGQIISTVSYWAAFGWCLGALFALSSLSDALRAFCECAAANSICADACKRLTVALFTLAATLMILLAASGASATGVGFAAQIALLIGITGATVASTIVFAVALDLASCQSTTPPTPPPIPPIKPGPGPTA